MPDGRYYVEQEIEVQRPKTITLRVGHGKEKAQNEVYAFMTTISKVEDIKQIIKKKHITEYFEVTNWEESKKNEAENLLSTYVLGICGTSFHLIDTIPMKLTERNPVIKVDIF